MGDGMGARAGESIAGGTRVCPRCGEPIVGRSSRARWCSESCRVLAWRERHTRDVAPGRVSSPGGIQIPTRPEESNGTRNLRAATPTREQIRGGVADDKDSERPKVSEEEKATLLSGCADAIASGVWAVLTPMAGDLFVRALAERLGITVEETDALVVEEIRRREYPPASDHDSPTLEVVRRSDTCPRRNSLE